MAPNPKIYTISLFIVNVPNPTLGLHHAIKAHSLFLVIRNSKFSTIVFNILYWNRLHIDNVNRYKKNSLVFFVLDNEGLKVMSQTYVSYQY